MAIYVTLEGKIPRTPIWNGKACWNGMSKTAIWPRMRWMTTR
nr:hypothetical protein [Vibrio alginolyticus]